MGSYYYLAAQLPYLVYEQSIPMSPDAFKNLARSVMSSGDAAVLDYCTLDPDPANKDSADKNPADKDSAAPENSGNTYAKPAARTSSSLLNRWKEWERTLRLNLARGRAQKLKKEGSFTTEVPDYPADAASAAKTALVMENPLEAELYLDRARWDVIESFQGINIFSENAIYAYLLKLLLMERRALLTTEEGFTEYKGLYAAIMEHGESVTVAGLTPGLVSETTLPGEPK